MGIEVKSQLGAIRRNYNRAFGGSFRKAFIGCPDGKKRGRSHALVSNRKNDNLLVPFSCATNQKSFPLAWSVAVSASAASAKSRVFLAPGATSPIPPSRDISTTWQ